MIRPTRGGVTGWRAALAGILKSLLLVAAVTALMAGLERYGLIAHNPIVFLIPVTIAALRFGLVPAIAAAIAGVASSAFFFFPPIFSFAVSSAEQIFDLALFMTVAIVISELMRQLSEARVNAQTEKLRQALIDSVSHELRTPLSSITGAASVLHASPVIAADPRLLGLTGVIRAESERLNEDIQRLLDSTRIAATGIVPAPQWTEAGDIVNSALDHCRARLARHTTEIAIAADLPLLHVDPALVEQALVQLLDNAAKYSPPATPIAIVAERDGEDIAIAVRDRGPGLTASEVTRVWDRFARGAAHVTTTRGSGLGLWIARAFVEASGGRIFAHSTGPGAGSTFRILLPAAKSDKVGPDADE